MSRSSFHDLIRREPMPTVQRDREIWYRAIDLSYASFDADGDRIGPGRVVIRIERYPVKRYTPKGAQLDVYGHTRFVKTDARKRFACPTIVEALASLKARKTRQVGILEAQAARAREVIRLVERGEYENG